MIIYRHPTETQPPPWLIGAYTRAEGRDGPIFARKAEATLQREVDVPWHEVEDGWLAAEIGETDPATLCREWETLDDGARRLRMADGHHCLAYPAHDSRARVWYAPVVLTTDGDPAMHLPWGHDERGMPCRRPTELQERLIQVARQAGAELDGGEAAHLPVEVVFPWIAELLEGAYHISRGTLLALGLIDDYLAVRLLLGACGYGTPEHPLESVA